jgi:hypothetical protein
VSPDGTRLAFRRATGDFTTFGIAGVYVAKADGSDPLPLQRAGIGMGALWDPDDVSASAPRWSPDGSRILALAYYSRFGPLPIRVIDASTGSSSLVGRAQEAAWLDADTLIVRGYEAPAGSTPTPSPSETPASSEERVGFLGLAPQGSQESLPAVGDLVVSFEYFCCPGRSMHVYADGRMVWSEFNIVGPGAKGYFPLSPKGADDWETGNLVQRLTPEGVELLRSTVASSGLFDEDHSFVKKGEELTIGIQQGGQMITLHAAKADDPFGATDEQAREILRITNLLKNPESWLPKSAWADRTIRAFVPSRYFVRINFYSNGGTTPEDPSELPPPADQLMRSADVVTSSSTCEVVSPAEARRIDADVREAFGGDLLIPLGFMGTPITINPALPHSLRCIE